MERSLDSIDRVQRLLVIGALCVASACASAPVTLSPAGARAFQVTRVVKGLDVLRDVAILGEQQRPPLIGTATTRRIVQYHQATLLTIQAAPAGWPAATLTGLAAIQATLTPDEARLLGPYFALVQIVLQEVH